MKRIAFNTLGCRLNQYETDALVSQFRNAGYSIAAGHEHADAYVINTCTVTGRSDRKSRALIYQAFRAAAPCTASQSTAALPDAAAPPAAAPSAGPPVIVVTGCFAENEANELLADHRITYAVDNDRKAHIFRIVDSHLRGEPLELHSVAADRFAYGDPAGGFHTRSTVKIQDGCDNFCSYCIIPRVRGAAVSRPPGEVLAEVSRSLEAGAKEIVITGVNIGGYQYGAAGFPDLLQRILDLDGDFRVRENSWEHGFLEMVDHPRLCPYLHLCLQSGSDRVLRAMGRRYSVSGFLEMADALRKRRPDFNLTTDIMVGFPGETEEDFLLTLEAAERAGFSHMHTFPYSIRPGTRAASMGGQVSSRVKAARAKIVRDLSARQKLEYRKKLIGRKQTVLVENIAGGVARGYGEHYVPVEVSLGSGGGYALAENTFLSVRLAGIKPGREPSCIGVAAFDLTPAVTNPDVPGDPLV